MKIKNRLISSLFILICMGFGMSDIYARNIVVGNGISINVPSNFSNYSESLIAVSGESSRDFAVGIRFSLVTADGTTVMSRNYFNESVGGNTYVLPGACNKLMYSKVVCAYGSNWTPINNASNISELETIFASQGLNVRFSSGIASGNLGRDYVFGNLFSGTPEANLPKIKNAINQLLSGTGKTIDNDFKLSNNTYNLFIEWEPLAKIRITDDNGTRHYFYGTTYELSNFVSGINGFNFNGANCAGSGNGAFCNFGKAVGKILGCSVFLDDENDMGQTVRNNIGDNLGSNFTGLSYFGGGMNLNWDSSFCSEGTPSSNLKPYATSANSSGGVGVIWIGEFGTIVPGTPACSDIYNYYGGKNSSRSPYTVIYENNNNSFNFTEFNNHWKSQNPDFQGIDITWFRNNCPYSTDNENNPYNCTPNYNVPSCTYGDNKNLIYSDTGQTGKDDEYWQKCIFNDEGTYYVNPHKTSAHGEGKLSYYDPALSSKYCEVFCVEDVVGNLAANNPVVLAGSHFVWGASSINTVRTCRTKPEVNWGNTSTVGSFYYDLKEANQAVADALAMNKLQLLNAGGSWHYVNDSYSPNSIEPNAITFTCENIVDISNPNNHVITSDGCAALYNQSDRANCRKTDGPVEVVGTYTRKAHYSFVCDKVISGSRVCSNYAYKLSSGGNPITSTTLAVGDFTGSATYTDFTKCTNTPPTGNPVTAGNVDGAISKVNSVLNEMNKCFSFNNTNVLNVDTSAIISYTSEGNMYDYTGSMKSDPQTVYSNDTCNEYIVVPALVGCSGTGCSVTTKSIKKCDTNEKTGNNITTLNLTGDVYRYVLKNPNGKTLVSIHGSELEGYKSGTLEYNWIDIGYANFPVPYNYSRKEYTGALNVNYSKIGHTISGETSTVTDRILGLQTGYGTYGNWSCNYTVQPDLIQDCDGCPLGINVIYREIDLARPFPDIDASNRVTGANWCSEDSCAWNNYVSDKYILNNRNVVGKEIYNLEPMYTFIMTPSDIIKIRKYNNDNEYSAYTGFYSGKTYNFKCVEGTGRGCRSEYLTELMNMLDTANYPGTCKAERGVTDIDVKFNACRY